MPHFKRANNEMPEPDMSAEEWIRMRGSEWWNHVSMEDGKRYHARNVKRCQDALEYYARKDRPTEILAIFGSGRNVVESCAHEESNSKLLLKTGLKVVEGRDDVLVKEFELRKTPIEPCNNCVATTSALCGFPCNCFPLDGMQDIYPLVLRADVLLLATGVNQSMVSTRMKAFTDRLISLDGGFYVAPDQFQNKDEEWKRRCMELSVRGDFAYTPRLTGRVCGYFITSKDGLNTMGENLPVPNYETLVAGSLHRSYHDYGCRHADPWYVFAAAVEPPIDYQFDKDLYNRNGQYHRRAEEVVEAAVALAVETRTFGYKAPVDRLNRT